MDHLEVIAGQTRWAGKNIAYNLEFIPPEKLDWKPSPSAKSTLEIVNHLVGALKFLGAAISRGQSQPPEFKPATDRKSAQALIQEAANEYAQVLKGLAGSDFNRKVELPFGTFPLSECMHFAVIDLFHHHGQIAYLQTIWGDTEDHFDVSSR
jgi:uncharacterized damage-inducible protein DinB